MVTLHEEYHKRIFFFFCGTLFRAPGTLGDLVRDEAQRLHLCKHRHPQPAAKCNLPYAKVLSANKTSRGTKVCRYSIIQSGGS